MSKNILVTGGNFGIGLALCKLLVKDHDCYVYLGCQDPTSGNNALMKIFQEVPDTYNIIQVIQIDVGDEQSCAAAAKTLEARGIKLYALVNAGIMKAEATNLKGPKLVTDALIGLLDKSEGRIVNVSSGAANMWLTQQNTETNKLSANPDISGEDLEAAVNQNVAAKNSKILNKYIKDIVDEQMSKHILVTGGNSGIGLALCKILVRDHNCYVYLGSRDVSKGNDAMKKILEEGRNLDRSNKIEVIQIDVGDDQSCISAAKSLKDKGVKLYALVNNAGVMRAEPEAVITTNFKGPKRVTDAFIELIDKSEGRIVNTSSGAASLWLCHQDSKTKQLFTNELGNFEDLEAAVNENVVAKNFRMGNGYGLSKAALNALTLIQAKSYPYLKITSLTPGFIDTPMTKGLGSKLRPEQGTLSITHCLFEPVVSGCYYGSDGLRSPLTVTRDPGTPEYEGEENPDPAKYSKRILKGNAVKEFRI